MRAGRDQPKAGWPGETGLRLIPDCQLLDPIHRSDLAPGSSFWKTAGEALGDAASGPGTRAIDCWLQAVQEIGPNPARQPRQTAPRVAIQVTPEAPVQRTPSESSSTRPDATTAVFLRMPTVMRMTGLGRSTIYRLIADQKFPCPVRLGPRAVAWRRSDLDRWSDARPAVTH